MLTDRPRLLQLAKDPGTTQLLSPCRKLTVPGGQFLQDDSPALSVNFPFGQRRHLRKTCFGVRTCPNVPGSHLIHTSSLSPVPGGHCKIPLISRRTSPSLSVSHPRSRNRICPAGHFLHSVERSPAPISSSRHFTQRFVPGSKRSSLVHEVIGSPEATHFPLRGNLPDGHARHLVPSESDIVPGGHFSHDDMPGSAANKSPIHLEQKLRRLPKFTMPGRQGLHFPLGPGS